MVLTFWVVGAYIRPSSPHESVVRHTERLIPVGTTLTNVKAQFRLTNLGKPEAIPELREVIRQTCLDFGGEVIPPNFLALFSSGLSRL